MKIVLIETSPPGQKGSMARYAELLNQALSFESNSSQIKISRINLALPHSLLSRVPISFRSWLHHFWIMLNASTKLPKISADIFHIIDGSQAYISEWIKHSKSIATSHDIIPLLQLFGRFDNLKPGGSSRWLIKKSIKGLGQVEHIIAVSNNTASDLSSFAKVDSKAISVIPHAFYPDILSHANSSRPLSWPERRESKHAFILHVGNDAFYKNREGLFRIFSRILSFSDINLKLVGSDASQKERQIINDLGINDHVSIMVYPDDAELFDLYGKACLFLFPSLYEGFGWPPLEAMALGCPVVCSNAASLPEVVEDAALTCGPEDEKKMAENCLTVLQDASIANRLIERGHSRVKMFSLEEMGRKVMEVYRKVLNSVS